MAFWEGFEETFKSNTENRQQGALCADAGASVPAFLTTLMQEPMTWETISNVLGADMDDQGEGEDEEEEEEKGMEVIGKEGAEDGCD